MIIIAKTPLGYKCIVNDKYEGLIYHNEIFEKIELGDKKIGYVKVIRKDGNIDLSLRKPGSKKSGSSADKILKLLKDNAGIMPYNYKSDSELIKDIFTEKKDILFGTQSIFSEGISLDCLSCLILGTPVNNDPLLTQLIGRIIRVYEGKPQPVILDLHLVGKTATKQANARMGYYIKEGYDVSDI